MTRMVTIRHGIGRQNHLVENITVPLLKEPYESNGRFCIKVDASETSIQHPNTKIYVNSENDFTIFEGNASDMTVMRDRTVAQVANMETDAEISERILETFTVLRDVAEGVADKIIRGLVIAGAPGVGKSYDVIKTVEAYGLVDKADLREKLASQAVDGTSETDSEDEETMLPAHEVLRETNTYELVKGHITASSLYELLWRNRHENDTIIMDDIDSIFGDDKALNLLKAALDTSDKRRIHWATAVPRQDGVPNSFEFFGSIIFISNKDFNKMKGSASVGKHIEALMSRSLFLDMGISSTREKLIRIKQVAVDGGLLAENGVTDLDMQEEIMHWMDENSERFRELSLRTLVHLATICKMRNWKAIARQTLLNK